MLSLIDVALQERSRADPAHDGVLSCIETTAINPLATPGELVIVVAATSGETVSGRIAVRLAVEHFVAAVLEFQPAQVDESPPAEGTRSRAVQILESGFERANNQIYSFGHRLAAGGALGSSLIAVCISGGELAAGRVGGGDVELLRGGERVQLFGAQRELASVPGTRESGGSSVLVGAHRQVPVEFLEVALAEYDAFDLWCEPPCISPPQLSEGRVSYSLDLEDSLMPSGPERVRYWWRVTMGPEVVFLGSPLGSGRVAT